MQFEPYLQRALEFSRHHAKNGPSPRRLQFLGFLITIVVLLTTAHFLTSPNATFSPPRIPGLLHTEKGVSKPDQATPLVDSGSPTPNSEKGSGQVGEHLHIRPSLPPAQGGIPGCIYPILIHVTPDAHCTGALGLYGSIVRNVLTQPEALKGKVCVHLTYTDPELKTIEEMYQWTPRSNPFNHVKDCALIDEIPIYNKIVPIRWQALTPIEVPSFMETGLATWKTALNKVHSWGFDLYKRILILDADSVVIRDLDKIFDEIPSDVTVAAPADQFQNCHDRLKLNGGMVLLRPSRYFHIVATELLYDQGASCMSGKWQQSEQELLNCICGTVPGHDALRPEFQCRVMPIYNSIWPKNYGCSDAQIVPWRSIHFTAAPKPWKVKEDDYEFRFDTAFWRCIRDLSRRDVTEGLAECDIPGFEITRTVFDWKEPLPA
jgi:hypothetical protein